MSATIEDITQHIDAGRIPEAAAGLRELRVAWRIAPDGFDEATVAALQSLASRVKSATDFLLDELLRSTFGFGEFRPGQREIIETVVEGADCIGVMPTGAGKSLTYQLAVRALGGTGLVISPLIALMKDQVDGLTEHGVRATFLNSTLDAEVRSARVAALRRGEYDLVYAAPEGLEASVGEAIAGMNLSLIAVDEAHCISQWGHDFRPAYRNLRGLKRRFDAPILALTATATESVTRDIAAQLALDEPRVFKGSFFRPNLKIHVFKKGEHEGRRIRARESIGTLCLDRKGESGIVYTLSRASAESTAEYLSSLGLKALPYHAGRTAEDRTLVQDAFIRDDVDVICATVAFGMGIDKSNVRYVIHRDMPKSLEGYYQEIGRAGRDGVDADCILFYSWADVVNLERMTADGDAGRNRAQIRAMYRWSEGTSCRHQSIVAHFGESMDRCSISCDVCTGADLLSAPQDRNSPLVASTAEERDGEVFQALRDLRRALADERGVPAYVIFSDATLLEMAATLPTTPSQLLAVGGVGPKKLESYGDHFLEVLRAHVSAP